MLILGLAIKLAIKKNLLTFIMPCHKEFFRVWWSLSSGEEKLRISCSKSGIPKLKASVKWRTVSDERMGEQEVKGRRGIAKIMREGGD